MTTTTTTSSTTRPSTTDHPHHHPFNPFDQHQHHHHHQPLNLIKNHNTTDQPSSNPQQQQQHHHHPHHSRNSSLASVASSIAPRTISSSSLSQLSNPITNESLLSSSITHRHQQSLPPQQPQSTISPLITIANKLPHLALSQQEPIRRTLESINLSSTQPAQTTAQAPLQAQQPPTLRLAHSWTLFFSDTSASKATNARGGGHYHSHSQRDHTSLLKAAEYQSGMSQVFTGIGDVEGLCASLAGFKMRISDGIRKGNLSGPPPGITSPNGTVRKLATTPTSSVIAGNQHDNPNGSSSLEDTLLIPGNGLGLIAMKPGQNLHFFRVGVNPVWEDPWNAKGGRLTIQTPLTSLDPTFESIVLLIAGGVLEADANGRTITNHQTKQNKNSNNNREGGRVVGVVGSRRLKGDRIEIWMSGPTIGTPPNEDWIRNIQAVLATEIGSPEVRLAKYKKHL